MLKAFPGGIKMSQWCLFLMLIMFQESRVSCVFAAELLLLKRLNRFHSFYNNPFSVGCRAANLLTPERGRHTWMDTDRLLFHVQSQNFHAVTN